MIRVTRGDQVPFTQTYYDDDNNITTVDSVTLTIIYPSSTTSGNLLSRDPGQLKAKETIVMTEDTGVWSAEWDSSVADPGVVYWNMFSSNPKITDRGKFVVEGNLANLEAF